VLLDTDSVNLSPVNDPVGATVLAAHPGNVDTVIVAGQVLKRGKQLVNVDLERILALAEESNRRHPAER
jgi:cytosine/adenosine deaminase-related metal-dependent hydrolase